MGEKTHWLSVGERLQNLLASLGLPSSLDWVRSDPIIMFVVLAATLGFICVSVLGLVWLERKVSARIQRRMGPMMTGPRWMAAKSMWLGGWLQTIADALKLLVKEDLTPGAVDRLVFYSAPVLVFTASLLAYVIIPFGPSLSITDLNVGIVYLVGVGSITVLGIMMAGWGSNNKYSLLGGLRSVAQMISYEIPMIFALLGPVLLAGSLSMQDIVHAQQQTTWFIVPNFIGFLVYLIAGTAETNRPPFDLVEGEQELVGGFVTEYSGMKFAMFFLAEFSNMFVVAAVATTVFLGGWSFPGLDFSAFSVPVGTMLGVLVFFVKTYAMIALLMWIRWTFPRVRVDHLMHFGWKTLLPFAFLNLLISTGYAFWLGPLQM